MRAQELVHLHGLLFEVRRYLEREDQVPPTAFVRYDANGVLPTHIHRGKEAHQRAIVLLLEGFATGIEADGSERPQVY